MYGQAMAAARSRWLVVLTAALLVLLSSSSSSSSSSAAAAAAAANVAPPTDQMLEEKTSFEAAFQGRCGRGSPCEQLCYELHDGMYECDCKDGFVLHKNGYSCDELNSTSGATSEMSELSDIGDDNSDSDGDDNLSDEVDSDSSEEDEDDDVLYMRGASFTIHLDSPSSSSDTAAASANGSNSNESDPEENNKDDDDDDDDENDDDDKEAANEIGEDEALSLTSQISRLESDEQEMKQQQQQQPSSSSSSTTEQTMTMKTRTSTTALMEPSCTLDCGPGGSCYIELLGTTANEISRGQTPVQRCQCPLGRGGDRCQLDAEVRSPRFGGQSWLAFPPLHAAYKHVQLELEFRPETWDGIILLAGERDDLQGDFMALIIYHGYVEFRFDCGSGVGIVRSSDTVKLNEWNVLNVYRHRWDAWLQLNQEKRVQGRSKGLFSRITFREPLFVGGPGNTTGLERLPIRSGFKGCVRNLEINEHRYRFPLAPVGDALNGFDVDKCVADRCSKVPCSHGGKCLTTSGDTAVCLCPLGYTGDLCETRVDLQVPSFNGSSYLKYPGLAETSLSWLELSLTIKPFAADGVILYNGHHSDTTGDFIALYLVQSHVHFTFDLGTGTATLRSEKPIVLGEWVEVRVSRTGRLASLEVERNPAQEILSPGAFTQLSLPLNMYLGGAPSTDMFSNKLKTKSNFVGCIQTVLLNRREMNILAEALGGANVGNCGHACESRPCGDAECRPLRDRFTCRCRPGLPHPCPAINVRQKQILEFKFQHGAASGSDGGSSSTTAATTILPSIYPVSKSMLERTAEQQQQQADRSVPSFTGIDSYLFYDDVDTLKRLTSDKVDINMRFRASSDGLLLWTGDRSNNFFALGLDQGYLAFTHNLGSRKSVLRYNLTRLDDDLWHRVRATRNEQRASLVVDNGSSVWIESQDEQRQPNTELGLYVGGAPDIEKTTRGQYLKGIVGCVSDLVLDSDYSVALSMPGQARNTHTCIP
uniref:Pikachurin n=1 Tax=Trichogramma kaykai TaxID=54128 RepID=A0ABD2X622_9HYME